MVNYVHVLVGKNKNNDKTIDKQSFFNTRNQSRTQKDRLMFVLLGLFSVCVAITNAECDVSKEPDVKQFDIRIPEIILPKNLTYYVCQQFEVRHHFNHVDTDSQYHMELTA